MTSPRHHLHAPIWRQSAWPTALAGATLALVLAACASTPPPTGQLAVASAALTHAAGAGATEAAPAEMASARQKLDRANAALAARDNDLALSLAQQAQVDAQLAEAKAHAGKAGQAASAVNDASRALAEELARKTQ
jgi:hypothetical protein